MGERWERDGKISSVVMGLIIVILVQCGHSLGMKRSTPIDAIVIGTGPGGCAAARTLSKNGMRVVMLERGSRVASTGCMTSCGEHSACAILARSCAVQRVPSNNDNLCDPCIPLSGVIAPDALGGGSAVNFGVWVAPSIQDLKSAFPERMRTDDLIEEYLREIDANAANSSITLTNFQKRAAQTLDPQVMQRDYVTKGQRRTLQRTHANHLTFNRHLRQNEGGGGGRMTTWDSLVNTTNVETRLHYDAEKIEYHKTTDEWTVVPWKEGGNGNTPLKAKKIFLACGAIETPALLMRSFRLDQLSEHVGRHMQTHDQSSTVLPAWNGKFFGERGGGDGDGNGISHMEETAQKGTHPIAFIYANKDGTSSAELMETSSSFSCASRCANMCTPRTFGSAVCCAMLPPHGLLWSCCYNDARLQIFRDSECGSVGVQPNGKAFINRPTSSSLQTKKAIDHREAVLRNLVDITKNPIRGAFVTSWHYVGTMRAPETDAQSPRDAAVDLSCRVLDVSQNPIPNLYVADASIARKVSLGNTMSLAAYAGFVAAKRSLEISPR